MDFKKHVDSFNVSFMILLLLFMYFELPLAVCLTSKDRNMVLTFEDDEYKNILSLERGLNNRLDLGFYAYGSVYFYVTILLLLPLRVFNLINDQAIKHLRKPLYGVLFHPEVRNPGILERFLKL